MGGSTNQVTHECLGRNLSLSTYGWKDETSHLRMPWSKFKVLLPTCGRINQANCKCLGTKFKSFYLQVEGQTKSFTCALVKILSPTTYGWKDHPSRPWVPWYKILVLLPMSGRTNQVIHECLGRNLSPSTYRWKDEPSHLRVPWSKFKVLLPTGGRTNQATSKCLGTKFRSFYLQVEGRTKSLTCVLVEIKVLLPMGGRMNQATR